MPQDTFIVSGLKAALFDMDGVLYNSMPGHVWAYREALLKYGVDIPAEVVYACEGMKGVDTMQQYCSEKLQCEVSREEATEMYETKCQLFRQLPRAEQIPGVWNLMKMLHDNGVKICVVTGSGQLSLLQRLYSDFEGMIVPERIVTAMDVEQGKPAPDPYLMGLKKCGVEASEAIVIENAPLGVRAARAAGIFTIAVNTGPLPKTAFEAEGANLIFSTMKEAEEGLVTKKS